VDRILYGFGYEYGSFRMSEMVQIQTGVRAEVDFLKSNSMCLRVVFMMRNNSLTKVIKRQYNSK
jgi:hypothetical protein